MLCNLQIYNKTFKSMLTLMKWNYFRLQNNNYIIFGKFIIKCIETPYSFNEIMKNVTSQFQFKFTNNRDCIIYKINVKTVDNCFKKSQSLV